MNMTETDIRFSSSKPSQTPANIATDTDEAGVSSSRPASGTRAELLENSLTAPILEFIAQAQDAHQLFHVEQFRIPHCIGITDEERKGLNQAVRDRFCELNAEAAGEQKPRWQNKRLVTSSPTISKPLHTSDTTQALPALTIHD
jgi:hypothetical protein